MSEEFFRPLHILVIDDEAFMRKLIERTLTDMGVGIISQAANGIEGIDFMSRTDGKIDLVICDLEMPEMNGFDFVKQVRGGSVLKEKNIPILILTGHADESTVKDAAGLGINGYLVKPISRKSLESRITKAIQSATK